MEPIVANETELFYFCNCINKDVDIFLNISLNNPHIKNYSWRIIQFIAKQGVNLFIIYFAANLLSKETFGIYNYVVAIVFLFTVLADFGISRAVTKFAAEYNSLHKDKVKSILFNAGLMVLLITSLFIGIVFLFPNTIAGKYHIYIKYLLPLFFFIPLSALFDGVYIGLRRFRKLAIINIIAAVVGLSAAYYLITNYGLLGAFYSLDVYYGALFIMLALTYPHYSFRFDKNVLYEVGGYAFVIGIASLGHFLYGKANSIILGKFDFLIEVGYYEIIDKILIMSAIPFMILGQVIAPGITEKVTVKKNEEVFSYFKKILTGSFSIGVIISILLFILIETIIKFFFAKYNSIEFYNMFYLLLLQLPFLVVSNSLAQPFIVGTGYAKLSLLTIPFGIVNVVLGVFLVTQIGFMGIVYSTLLTSIGNKVVTYTILFFKLKKAI